MCIYVVLESGRNRLVSVFLKSVPLFMSCDIICVEISAAKIFARF